MPEDPRICIRQATIDDKPVVAELLQAYLHDMTPFTGDDPDQPGSYAYPYFDLYWSPEGVAEGRIPYLIIADKEVAGFAFVNRYSRPGSPDTRNIAEFYVIYRWRRNGVGMRAAQRLFRIHPGRWEIAVLRANTPALAFWTAVVNDATSGQFETSATDPDVWDGTIITFDRD